MVINMIDTIELQVERTWQAIINGLSSFHTLNLNKYVDL